MQTKQGLSAEDIQSYSLAKVREEMKTRHSRLEEIKEQNGGKLIEAEGDHGLEAAKLFRELNVLGEKHDELAPIADGEGKLKGLGDWLNTPAGEIPVPQGSSQEPSWKSATDLILESAGYKRYQETGQKQFAVEMPWDALFGQKGTKVLGLDDSLAGVDDEFPAQSIRLPGLSVPVLFQQNNIAPTFLQGTTTQSSIAFMQETVTSEGAAETAEGATKPEADLSFTESTAPVATVAVTLQVTNQLLEDVGFMRAYVQGRLRLFVLNREDNQLINGDGTGVTLTGMLNAAGTNAESFSLGSHTTDGTVGIDAIYDGMVAIREAFLDPSTVGMAAATWALFQLAKDGNNNYLLGGPGMVAAPRIWGVPVVQNERFPAASAGNEAIAIWAREAAMVVRRNSISFAVSDSHGTTFTENVLTFRAEERLAFPIFRPAGITVVTTAA